jgi:NAD(P)-dependent dehydrogenase (short-subunit alcohol dehydrogenase family)
MSSKLQSKASWEAGPLAFLSRQFIQSVPPIPKSTTLHSQTAIITGSNIGLGFEAARQLLTLGLSHLIIAVRSQSKGDAAAKTLRAQFPAARIEVSIVDMASHKSIVEFVKRCESLERLDIVILNAGLSRPRFERADETKHEMTLQVNYLSTALLSILLVPLLKSKRGSTSPARLAVVGSDTSYWADWPDLNSKSIFETVDNAASSFSSMDMYKKSKLYLLLFLEKLSQHVSPDEVIINYPNPGACKGTAFGADGPAGLQKFMFKVVGAIMARTMEMGARQYLDAVLVQGKESHGSFVGEGTLKP